MKEQHNNLDVNIITVAQALAKNLTIPDYQRAYRWNEENVSIFMEDILESLQNEIKEYRIGNLILHRDKENFFIVDGQQRITTILLMLKKAYPTLQINLFKTLKYKHNESEKNIKNNYKLISSWIEDNLKKSAKIYAEYLLEHCKFTEIIVSDLSEAFQMFDSQNTRGKKLESYNLLKAYHIRAMESEKQTTKIEYDKKWEHAVLFKKRLPDNSELSKDLLKQIFNEQLYRTRIWSKKEPAFKFDRTKIDEFKGITLQEKSLQYPFYNILFAYLTFNEKEYKKNLNIKPRISNEESINPFVSINQPIINGKLFFEYILSYVEMYKLLFINGDEIEKLQEFKNFYEEHCFYEGAFRAGDRYLREAYKSAIFLLFDKYGIEGVQKFYKLFYLLIYRNRLEKIQVRYKFVAQDKKITNLFSTIENSKKLNEIKNITKEAKKSINLRKKVDRIENVFKEEGVI